MRFSCSFGRGIAMLLGACAALLSGFGAPPAVAASRPAAATIELSARHTPTRYFVEFRGRAAASYGHLYVLYGMVNANGEIVESKIAGLHPAGDAANCYNCSLFNWTVGHVVFVPSDTGASDGDLEEQYVTARYRVWVNRSEYIAVTRHIREMQAHSPLWNALWKNCVGFGRDVAVYMGLKIPPYFWMEPENFVNALRKLNGMKRKQLPLRDAANALKATEAKAEYAASRHLAQRHDGLRRTARYARLSQRAQSSAAQRRVWSHDAGNGPFDGRAWTELKNAFAELTAPPRRSARR